MNEENQLLNWILPLVSCDILRHFGNFLKTLLMNKFPKYYHFNLSLLVYFALQDLYDAILSWTIETQMKKWLSKWK